EAMVQADPELAWLKEMEQRGDIDWQRVKEVHDSFKYSSSGLGGAAALVIAIVVTYLTWGAGSAIAGSASSAAAGAGAGASTAAFAGSAAQAVFHATVNSAAISTVNNRGDLGAVLKDVTSSDALKGYAVSAISGGMTGGLDGGLTAGNVGLRLAVNSALDTLVNGGSFKDNLVQAGINLAANALTGAIYEQVGDSLVGSGLSTKVAVHAIVGGLIAEAAGGDFKTGALAAGANEALLELVGDKLFPGDAHEQVIAMTSQLVGMTVAAAAGGDDKAQEKAGWVAQQAAIYNHELHRKNAENFVQGIQDACAQRSDLCGSGYQEVSQQELVHALQVTAAHGVGIENVNPEALRLVNQFLVMFSGTSDTLFSPTDSEQARIDVIDTVELIGAGISLASAAKSALKSGGGLLDSLKGLFGGGAKGNGSATDNVAPSGSSARPTPKQSEIDVGTELGAGARPQISYKNGQEVPYGTAGSVRPDWCIGSVCSVEVKNYKVATNQQGLINNVSKQALQRAENLPQGMQQQIVIDVRGQVVTDAQKNAVIKGIVQKSKGTVSPTDIRFKSE
ncbi:DUF637 domain-containing protein, partial [Stutzerimonas kirkiae]